MKKRVLKATSFRNDSLLKGLVLPDNVTQVVGVMESGELGKTDVLLVQEYDIEEPA